MRSTLVLCLFISALLSSAQMLSRSAPVGRWKTVDDATNRVKSVVVIWEENGKLNGEDREAHRTGSSVPRSAMCALRWGYEAQAGDRAADSLGLQERWGTVVRR